ncbi:MAG: hypothetical protein R6X16_14135 [Anaerolineae bacterium]
MSDHDPKKSTSADEWRDLFANIGNQVRRDMARMVGTSEDAGWTDIGKRTDESARQSTAKAVGADPDADWDDIGKHLETSTRREIGKIVGTTEDADWGTIGQAVCDGIEGFLNDLFSPRTSQASKPFEEPADPDAPVDPWTKA